jgi:hypothetical protein
MLQPESQIVVFGQRCLDSGIAGGMVKEYLRPSPLCGGHGQAPFTETNVRP